MNLRESFIDEVAKTAYYEENLREYYNSFVNNFRHDLPFATSLYIGALEEACLVDRQEEYTIRINHDKLKEYLVLLPDIRSFEGFLNFVELGIIEITKLGRKRLVITDKKAMISNFDTLDDIDKRLFDASDIVDLFIVMVINNLNDEEIDEYLKAMDSDMARLFSKILINNQKYQESLNSATDQNINYSKVTSRIASSLRRIKKVS